MVSKSSPSFVDVAVGLTCLSTKDFFPSDTFSPSSDE